MQTGIKRFRFTSYIYSFAVLAFMAIGISDSHAQAWHKELNDTCQGINLNGAYNLIKKHSLSPRKSITVAIIDSGIDTLCRDVTPALWTNPGEKADGIDNDGNGYIDDLHGWNFLGTKDGSFNMTSAGTEEYREFKRLHPKYKDAVPGQVADTAEYNYYQLMRRKAGIDTYIRFFEFNLQKEGILSHIDSLARARRPEIADTMCVATALETVSDDSICINSIDLIAVDLLKAGDNAPWSRFIDNFRKDFNLMAKRIYGIENEADKRLLMGDDLKNEADIHYGNNCLQADGCEHGTFVAGVIAGRGINDPKISGIFPEVKLMILRAAPDGDEYDKDIATGIRYAVDNGADIINMSLGKMTSPDADMVNRAIRYALDHDVLIIQAAGNSSKDIEPQDYFPSAIDPDGKPYANYMRVGSSDKKGGPSGISNYGKTKVDVFAPGDNITGNTVDNKFMTSTGTSIAAPVATAVAAMLRAYYPELSAADIKEVMTESCRRYAALSGKCRSNGVIDAEAAMEAAARRTEWNKVEHSTSEYLEPATAGRSFYTTWIEGTPCFYYNVRDNNRTHYYLVDASNGCKTEMIPDFEKFAQDYTTICGDTLDTKNPRLYGITFEPGNSKSFFLKKNGKQMRYDIAKRVLTESRAPKEKQGKKLSFGNNTDSPDSTYTMLGSGYDLYLRHNPTGNIKRITFDGKKDAAHTYRCKPDTTAGNAEGQWYGNRYMHVLYDNSGIKETGLIESLSHDRPVVKSFKMPLPGDEGIRRISIFWYNPETDESRYLPIDKYADQAVDVNYHKDPKHLFFTRKSRKGDHIDLCRVNIEDGTVKELISEECKPHINLTLFNYHLLNGGKEILWWSERTGRGNYYLYDGEGNLKCRVTSGDSLVAGNILEIDTIGRKIIFSGYGNEPGVNPYYRMYYTARLDGKRQQLLTPGNFNHEITLSPDNRYAVDRYSRIDYPTSLRAVNVSNPGKSHEVDKLDISELVKMGWKAPQRFQVKAADGVTDLYGIMFLPSDFDPAKRYPIITNVYPGPQDDQITQGFSVDDNGNQSLAELGFIVINSPSRGSSPLRGRDFYTFGYGNLRDYPLADDKNTIEQLAARHPFIDLDRVGIYGHSGGGFQTVAAMLTYPEFYKVGVAASGNHDNNIYIQWWGEAFHGLEEATDPETGKTVFKSSIPTNMELAPNLNGRLLLITGDVDNNVPPSNTYRLADALIKQGKRFDMMVLPGKDHGVMSPYYQNMIRYYFKEHLTDPKPFELDIIKHKTNATYSK